MYAITVTTVTDAMGTVDIVTVTAVAITTVTVAAITVITEIQ
jgi:hypothetical protein